MGVLMGKYSNSGLLHGVLPIIDFGGQPKIGRGKGVHGKS